jgi:hypothetical protein
MLIYRLRPGSSVRQMHIIMRLHGAMPRSTGACLALEQTTTPPRARLIPARPARPPCREKKGIRSLQLAEPTTGTDESKMCACASVLTRAVPFPGSLR